MAWWLDPVRLALRSLRLGDPRHVIRCLDGRAFGMGDVAVGWIVGTAEAERAPMLVDERAAYF